MKYTWKFKLNLIRSIFFLLLIVVGIFSWLAPQSFSDFLVIENVWSGEIATSFDGGNGTEENPYRISRGEELAYFKSLIEGNDSEEYIDKYYIITSNINMGNLTLDPIGNETNIFKGHIDGQGYTITNLKINKYVDINNSYYIGIFSKLQNATIENINLSNVEISSTKQNNSYLGILSGNIESTTIKNVSLYNNKISIEKEENIKEVHVGGISGLEKKSSVENSYINVEIEVDNNINKVGSLIGESANDEIKLNNIIVDSNILEVTSNNDEYSNVYTKDTVPSNFVKELNEEIYNDSYEWVKESDTFYLKRTDTIIIVEDSIITDTNITIHESGVENDTIYINDLDSDYYYYLGLNYTTSSDGKLPTLDNKNLYNEKNLVQVQITYNGSTTLNGNQITGYVSTTELQNKYIYFKTMVVNDNGTTSKDDDYVEIELIDNPFTNRPKGLGFNGWHTSYPKAVISHNSDIYVRYAKVPVKYNGDIPEEIVIEFIANWTAANISFNNTTSITDAISGFYEAGMQLLEHELVERTETPIYGDLSDKDMANYYTIGTVNRYGRYPNNSYNVNGTSVSGNRCYSSSCQYYLDMVGTVYNANTTYYELVNGTMQVVDHSTIEPPIVDVIVNEEITPLFNANDNMSTYFEKVNLTNGTSLIGYYNEKGEYQTSGSCSSNSCTYYKLIQYFDENGNANNYNPDKEYYYLVTRDTNIYVLRTDFSSSWGTSQTKPLTITGSYDGTLYNVEWNVSGSAVRAGADLVIENIVIYSGRTGSETNPSSSNTTARYFFGNWFNTKIGRGITRSGTNAVNFISASGGNNTRTGSSSNITNYRFIVESGYYSSLSLTGGTSSVNVYINGEAIYGNDYDRVTKNNDNFDVYFCASGSWGNNVYKNGATSIAMHTLVKSGKIGSARPTTIPNNNTSNYSYGLYVGGRQGGKNYTAREVHVEGGYIYNLIGGPLAQENNSSYNDTYIYVKGGEIEVIIGGAGRTETYGNRIIQVTSGLIDFSIFGGSNGITSETSSNSTQTGALTGTPYIYVGGNSIVGNEEYVNNNETLFGFEAGSIFGIGNGKSASERIGTADNSYIIIDNNATILRNVYGGGNYGAVGIQSSGNSPQTQIEILGGTIRGSVFGGGNRNGSGTTSKTSQVTINMSGGTIEGSIYGGANEKGTIYGNVNINVKGGQINNDIYGGGYGGSSDTSTGTFIRDKVTVVVGDDNVQTNPTINGSVYGGSAFGTVNGITASTTISSYDTQVTINKGTINTSVFGGGKGNSTYTPYVLGNILVTINGGNIADAFGGNDAAGTPNGTVTVIVNDGTIGRVFGGGNNSSVKENEVRIKGGSITNVFGGSNASGTVTTSNVYVSNGIMENVYGGNNTAGNTVTSNVSIDGGNINQAVYGGGKLATTTTTNIFLNSTNIPNVYGGGQEANVENSTNVELNGSTVGNLFGGSNKSGTVNITNINLNDGIATNVFGGNNLGGSTTTTNINMNNGLYGTIYGGGNKVGIVTSNIILKRGSSKYVYGGSNEQGDVEKTNITTVESTNIEGLTMIVTHSKSWDINPYSSSSKINVEIRNNTNTPITKWNASIITTPSELVNNWSSSEIVAKDNIYSLNEINRYWGTNPIPANGSYSFEFYTGNEENYESFDILGFYIKGSTDDNVEYTNTPTINIGDLYGGNNQGGTTNDPNITLKHGTYNNVYGGGNKAITSGDTSIVLEGPTVIQSVYGGGNQAAIHGNTNVSIYETTNIGNNVFGGGNHGAVGSTTLTGNASVNIAGATIGKNVYGGCNTSVVYGVTEVNIGKNAINDNDATSNDIIINGTVFGGGEANEAGSEKYDFDFISVTEGITINIDGTGYITNNHDFIISGSIFGSGNASSSAGPSNILVRKLGTRDNPNSAISIQRADTVVIDDSTIELIGTTDRTNEYSNIKYSFNRIKELKIKNNATLLLRENANMLEKFSSLVDIDGTEVKAVVTIDDESKTVTRNVDNRLYLLAGKNLNVTTNEAATSYGVVSGMTFLGMYQKYGNYVYGMYSPDKSYGTAADAGDVITGGSYVLGLHNINHDITVDGYYSNYIDDEYTTLTTAYVEPTPPDSNYYMWTIGTASINYAFNLTASKYSSLGTATLSMKDFSKGNTIFNVIGFNADGLNQGVVMLDSLQVPKLAATTEEANNIIGLAMKAETTEWTSHGTTKFLKGNESSFSGTKQYKTDNQTVAPSLMFYLYHAKNISSDQTLGTVVITLQALTPTNEIDYELQLVTITITIDTKDYNDSDAYDASITYNKKYEMPTATDVNITNKSQFTSYFALFAETESLTKFYGQNNDYYHSLISSYALPVGTKITMIDYGIDEDNPQYYYLIIDENRYQESLNALSTNNEVVYRLDEFIKMGSTSQNNTYKDNENNEQYFHENINYIMEEFIFIFDFKDTENVGEKLNNSILFELRNNEDRTIISVLGIRQNLMQYNLYQSSNVVLTEELNIDTEYLYYDNDKEMSYRTSIGYNQTELRQSIIDTNYESSSMGINVLFYDKAGNQVSSSLLSSTTIVLDGTTYYVDSNGIFRIKLADKVSNLTKRLILNSGIALPIGEYTMHIELFASNDGLHNSSDKEPTILEQKIIVVGNNNMIKVELDDASKLIDGETILNMNGTKEEKITLKYESVLSNPNIRINIYKRSTDTSLTNEYIEYNAKEFFTNSFFYPQGELVKQSNYEYIISTNPQETIELTYKLKSNIKSGTYRIVFTLYDGNQPIDEDYEYIIVRKKV